MKFNVRIKIITALSSVIFSIFLISTIIQINILKYNYLTALSWRSESFAHNIASYILENYSQSNVSEEGIHLLIATSTLECIKLYEANKNKELSLVAVSNEKGIYLAHNNPGMLNFKINNPVLLKALAKKEFISTSDNKTFYNLYPVVSSNFYLGTVIIGIPRTALYKKINFSIIISLSLFIVFLFLSVFLATFFLNKIVITPLNNLIKSSLNITKNKKKLENQNKNNDEFEILTKKFSDMQNAIKEKITALGEQNKKLNKEISDREKAEKRVKDQNIILEKAIKKKQLEMEELFEKLLRNEKMATIGKIAGNLAHELRNPLGAVKASVYYLNQLINSKNFNADNPKISEHLALLEKELNNSFELINSLLGMSNIKKPLIVETVLDEIIKDSLKHSIPSKDIEVKISLPETPFRIKTDPFQFRQILINLLTNAVQAINGKGIVSIKAFKSLKDKTVTVEIKDSGTGIKKELVNKIFEPLFTTKAKGTGLGLSICKQIIENQNGKLFVKSSSKKGTTIAIIIPFVK